MSDFLPKLELRMRMVCEAPDTRHCKPSISDDQLRKLSEFSSRLYYDTADDGAKA